MRSENNGRAEIETQHEYDSIQNEIKKKTRKEGDKDHPKWGSAYFAGLEGHRSLACSSILTRTERF